MPSFLPNSTSFIPLFYLLFNFVFKDALTWVDPDPWLAEVALSVGHAVFPSEVRVAALLEAHAFVGVPWVVPLGALWVVLWVDPSVAL